MTTLITLFYIILTLFLNYLALSLIIITQYSDFPKHYLVFLPTYICQERKNMNIPQSLEEDIQHGTPKEPIYIERFYGTIAPTITDCFHVDRHWHHNVECLLIQKGRYLLELNMETIFLNPGDICLINSGELHMLTGLSPDTCHDAIIFNPRILEFSYTDTVQEEVITPFLTHTMMFPHIFSNQSPYYSNIYTYISDIVNRWLYYSADSTSTNANLDRYFHIKLILLELLYFFHSHNLLLASATILSASEKEKIDRYKTIVSFMKSNIANKVTLEQLAEVAQCNPQYLCQFFKDFTGVTPIQYLITLRIEYACIQLSDTTKSILEVSLDSGFDNVSYFIRQFKQHTGMTPNAFRKGLSQ